MYIGRYSWIQKSTSLQKGVSLFYCTYILTKLDNIELWTILHKFIKIESLGHYNVQNTYILDTKILNVLSDVILKIVSIVQITIYVYI